MTGAGQVAAGANHLVAVDLSVASSTGSTLTMRPGRRPTGPGSFRPPGCRPNLADAEIVACIQADQATVQLEVCRYAGGLHTIARYESARQVVAVEAATGHVLAVVALTDRANECDVLEKTSTSAKYGDVMPEQAWAALDGLVSTGRFQSVCQVMCADAPIDDQSDCQASCAGDSIRDQLGPWGFEAAGEALRLDLDVLRTELATLDTSYSPDASLRTIAEDRGMAYADVPMPPWRAPAHAWTRGWRRDAVGRDRGLHSRPTRALAGRWRPSGPPGALKISGDPRVVRAVPPHPNVRCSVTDPTPALRDQRLWRGAADAAHGAAQPLSRCSASPPVSPLGASAAPHRLDRPVAYVPRRMPMSVSSVRQRARLAAALALIPILVLSACSGGFDAKGRSTEELIATLADASAGNPTDKNPTNDMNVVGGWNNSAAL